MKLPWFQRPVTAESSSSVPRGVDRRGLVVGAGVAAGAALAAAALNRGVQAPASEAAAATDAPAETGYRLTEHVRRYYETTRS